MGVSFPVSVVITALDGVTAKTRAIASGIQKATAPLSKLESSFAGLGQAFQFAKLQRGFSGVGDSLGELGGAAKRAGLIVGGLVGAAGVSIYELVHGFAESGDSAVKAAQKIGIGVEKLQELRFAAQLGNVETEDLDKALIRLARNAALSARGNAQAATGFRRLGIDVFDSNHHLRDAGSLFEEIAEKFGRLDDPLKKAALAQDLFGKAGAHLIPTLDDGVKGLREAAAEAHRFGIVLSKDAAEKGEVFMDNMTRVGAALRGVRNVMGEELLPMVEGLANGFRDWLVENMPRVREFARSLARDLPKALRAVSEGFSSLWEKLEPVRAVLGRVYEAIGPLGVALGVLAGVLVVTLAPAVLSVVASLATLSVALVSTPAGWVVLAETGMAVAFVALAAAIALVISHWDQISVKFPATAKVLEFLGRNVIAYLATQITGLATIVEFAFKGFLAYSEELLSKFQHVGDFFAGLWISIREGFGSVYGFIVEKLQAIEDLVPEWALKLAGVGSGPPPASTEPFVPRISPVLAGPDGRAQSQTTVKVDFSNVPRGTKITADPKGDADVDLSMGYTLSGP